MSERTTITVATTTKETFDELKEKYRYKSNERLLEDMQEFFKVNGLNPREHKEIYSNSLSFLIKKTVKDSDKKLRKYIGHEFKETRKLLGQENEEISLSTIDQNLNTLANWLIKKFDEIDSEPIEFTAKKEEVSPLPEPEIKAVESSGETGEKIKQKLRESVDYLLNDLKQKSISKGGSFVVNESDFMEFELSINNLFKQ